MKAVLLVIVTYEVIYLQKSSGMIAQYVRREEGRKERARGYNNVCLPN
jgi:hypothetical protein